MNLETMKSIWAKLSMLLALLVWAFVISMACYVSTIILQTLAQIVDLAAISP